MAWSDIPGWFSFSHAYDEMVEVAKDGDTIVEIGVAFGRSVAYLSRKVIDSGKDVKIIAVDPWLPRWDKHPRYPHLLGWGGEHAHRVKALGGPFNSFVHMMLTQAPEELERVHVIRGTSKDAWLMVDDHQCAGVLIDGSHDYDEVREDIRRWRACVKPGGILAGDDFERGEFPGVVQAVEEAFGSQLGASEHGQDFGFEVKGTTWLKRI